MSKQHKTQEQLHVFSKAFQGGSLKSLRHMLNGLPHEQIAHLLESSPPKLREALWKIIFKKNQGGVLVHLSEEIQSEFLQKKNVAELAALTTDLDSDDIADILQQLPERIISQVLEAMDEQNRNRIERIIHYAEDSAAGLMDLDTICVRPRLTLDVVLRYLRFLGELPPSTDNLFVINRNNQFLGILPIAKLIISDPETTVRKIMVSNVKTIEADMPSHDVALLFERHDWISAPVVDSDNKLLGRITIDDVVDVIREDADHSILSMAGLDEDQDTFSPPIKTTRDRAIWLGINLLTAFIAASTIKVFEDTIDKIVALAVLMPIVAGMGGVAGSQTLTIIIRGMALGQVGAHNYRWLLQREFIVGVLNGLLWALITAAVTALWFNDIKLAWIIALAMIINLTSAALAGTLLPLIFDRFNIDPALASTMALTTITDVVGFFSFLGLATYFYM